MNSLKILLFLLVYTEHFFVFFNLTSTGNWSLPLIYKHQSLGGLAVSTFFIITTISYISKFDLLKNHLAFVNFLRKIYFPYLFMGIVYLIWAISFLDFKINYAAVKLFIKYILFYPLATTETDLSIIYAKSYWTMVYTFMFYTFGSLLSLKFDLMYIIRMTLLFIYIGLYPFNNELFLIFLSSAVLYPLITRRTWISIALKKYLVLNVLCICFLFILPFYMDSRFSFYTFLIAMSLVCIFGLYEVKLKYELDTLTMYFIHGFVLYLSYYFGLFKMIGNISSGIVVYILILFIIVGISMPLHVFFDNTAKFLMSRKKNISY